jgi:spermidine/putrescine transport system permease protein
MMKKKKPILSSIYMWLVLAFFYIPIVYVVFFSFNSSKVSVKLYRFLTEVV